MVSCRELLTRLQRNLKPHFVIHSYFCHYHSLVDKPLLNVYILHAYNASDRTQQWSWPWHTRGTSKLGKIEDRVLQPWFCVTISGHQSLTVYFPFQLLFSQKNRCASSDKNGTIHTHFDRKIALALVQFSIYWKSSKLTVTPPTSM